MNFELFFSCLRVDERCKCNAATVMIDGFNEASCIQKVMMTLHHKDTDDFSFWGLSLVSVSQ